jgi:hypothetical protein
MQPARVGPAFPSSPAGSTRAAHGRALPWAVFVALLTSLLFAAAAAWAQSTADVRPVARVTAPVNDGERTVLRGHVLPAVKSASARDVGRVAPQTVFNHMIMVLKASPEQDHALETLIGQQVDKGSPNYHRWLQPEEFGERFGVDDSDVAKVTAWLTQQGFTVEHVAKSKRLIQFSGNVATVESAFRTQMHSYDVNGKPHIANNSDISVPTALQPVIVGVPTLHDFFKTSNLHKVGTVASMAPQGAHSPAGAPATPVITAAGSVTTGTTAGTPATAATAASTGPLNLAPEKFSCLDPATIPFSAPDYTNGTTHFVGAGDFAMIYNTAPLLTAGHDGTGVTIGIMARTDINLSDVQVYREFFNLKVNDPQFIVVGEDPGIVPGDDTESYLDAEVSGGAAPGASIKFITARSTLVTDGVDLSAMYVVENNVTDIISESYGGCEANFDSVSITFFSNLWGEAAAQGQTVFLSSGDNGPASCDSSNSNFSSFGYAVSGLASSPFNVAVGGTLFADTTGGPFWGSTATPGPPFTSALGYIPETPWNEAKASGAVGAAGLWSGSGGISSFIPTPPWQRGFGVPVADPAYPDGFKSTPATFQTPGPHRYLPDVSLAAAAQHDGTLYCAEGICQLSSTNTIVDAGIVGGTSVAAPTMAGIQALIDDVNGGRQGLVNYVYYALADAQHTAGLNCTSSSPSINPGCAFHDITTGNTLICGNAACTAASKLGWTAGPGYDLATGLGSPNAANLANLWSTVTFRSTNTTLNASQTTGIAHGSSVTLSGTVTPGSGSGTPTGNVTFIPSSGGLGNPQDPNSGALLNPAPLATLDGSGNYSIAVTNLPAGTYTLVARYGGDGTFSPSTSAPVTLTVTPESATVTVAPNAFNGTTCVETAQTTFVYGSYVWTDINVAGASGQGVPTGTVAVTDNGNPLVTTSLNANGAGHFLSGAIPTSSCVSGFTFQDAPPLIVGTHVLGASYSGDATFGAATATPVTVTITPATVTGALATGSTNISSGGTVQLTATLAGLSGAGPGTLNPTGTVTFTDNTTATTLGTGTLNPTTTFGARAVLSTTGITTAGAHSIVASWPGDANYNAVTTTAVTVTVQAGTATSVVVTSNSNPAALGGRPTFTATMTPTTVTSGTVGFYDGNLLLGTGTVGAAHTATFRPAAAVVLAAGTHMITAVYAGTATFNSSTSAPLSQVFNALATTLSLTVKNAGTYGQKFAFNAVLGSTVSSVMPSGTVQFMDSASPLGSPQKITTVSGGFGIFQAQMAMTLTAGTHTITAALSDPNYSSAVSNSQTIVVNQAVPALTAMGGTFTYNGAPHGGSGTATGGLGESLAVTLNYVGTGSTTYGPTSTAPIGAGTYSVTAQTAGDTNNLSGSSTPATLTILKANSTITAVGGTFTYNGTAQGGSGTATGGAGETLAVALSYSGTGSTAYGPSATAPTDAGTYLVTAATAGDTNNHASTSTPVALTILKATSTINAVGGTFTYNGTPQGGSGTATGGAGETLAVTLAYSGTGATSYGPSATPPTNAGTYLVTASTVGDTNNNAGSSKPAALTILMATSTVNAVGGTFTYNGMPQGGSGTATGGAGESLPVTLAYSGTGATTYGPSATAPTNAGTYQVTAQTVGNANNAAGTSAPAALTINKATATIAVTGYCATFNGNPHTATGTATGVLSESLAGLVLTGTTHTTVGTFPADAWTFTNANYGNANGTVGDSVTDAAITAPTHLAAETSGTASVVDAGAGATYTWTIIGGSITAGNGTSSITFKSSTNGTITLSVAITTATACVAGSSATLNIDPVAQVPTLGNFGAGLLVLLLALAALAALRGRARLAS